MGNREGVRRAWRGGASTYAKLDGNGEEVDAGLLGDLSTAGDTGEVDIAGLDEALGTLDCLEQLLGESGVAILSAFTDPCCLIGTFFLAPLPPPG